MNSSFSFMEAIMADGKNVYDIGDFVDVPWLSDSVFHESTRDAFWTKLLRMNYVESLGREVAPPIGNLDKGKVTWSGAPIEVFSEFEQGGLDEIRVPVKMQYRGDPRAGRTQLQGTGEGVDFLTRTIPIWNLKKAFTAVVPHTVDGQALRKHLEQTINNEIRPGAAKWLRDYTEGDIMHTILTGFSANLTPLRGILGYRTDIVPYSHPNFFVAGHGRVMHGITSDQRPGGEGMEERIVGALNTMMASDSATNVGLSPERLIALRNDMGRLKIPKIKTPAGEFYGLVVKDSAYTQLEKYKDTFRNDIIQSLPRDLRSNPFFGDVVAVFQQFIIYTYSDLFGVQVDGSGKVITHTSSTLGMPSYGPVGSWMQRSGSDTSVDTSDLALCYAFGAGFLSQVWGKVRMKWTMEKWDHEQNREIGMHIWNNLVRADIMDYYNKLGYGANAFGYNDTSAILAVRAEYKGSY